jgi:DNA-binding CsgD family transcriptional regulator
MAAGPPASLSVGFLLLDAALKPIMVNTTAARILTYPRNSKTIRDLEGFLATRIRSALVSERTTSIPSIASEYRSGRRLYICRSFQANSLASGGTLVAVLLERGSTVPVALHIASEQYHLTSREEEVLHLLLGGLTSKEIACRMGISPNTVKAFLRLIMLKMGVSTRSGIVGKAVTAKP